jgi:peptide deformylase
MAVLKLAILGDPVLRLPAARVADPASDEVAAIVGDLEDTLIQSAGNGIAAPQVGISTAVVLYRIAESKIPRGSDIQPLPLRVLVNPRFTPTSDAIIRTVERCMSVPLLQGEVPRFASIRVEAVGTDGAPITIDAEGYHAVLLQHEIDHLNGVMFIDRMDDMTTLMFESESRRDYRASALMPRANMP